MSMVVCFVWIKLVISIIYVRHFNINIHSFFNRPLHQSPKAKLLLTVVVHFTGQMPFLLPYQQHQNGEKPGFRHPGIYLKPTGF